MNECEHGVEATLWTDVQGLGQWGINPDCLKCIVREFGAPYPGEPEHVYRGRFATAHGTD